jgi:hypothetical protein
MVYCLPGLQTTTWVKSYRLHEWRVVRFLVCCVGASVLLTVSHMLLRSYPNSCSAAETLTAALKAVYRDRIVRDVLITPTGMTSKAEYGHWGPRKEVAFEAVIIR